MPFSLWRCGLAEKVPRLYFIVGFFITVPSSLRSICELASGAFNARCVKSPLAGKEPGDIDFFVVRENSEGEYSAIGGKAFEGTDREFVLQEAVFTRHGVDRILKYAFEMANTRKAKKLTAATKSNGLSCNHQHAVLG